MPELSKVPRDYPDIMNTLHAKMRLTIRWSQPLAGAMGTFNFMKRFSMLATVAAASGGSAFSR